MTDARLKRSVYRDAVRMLANELHINGNVAVIMDGHRYAGRTASINPAWWQNAADTLPVRKAWRAVDKALSGQRLGAAELRTVRVLLDEISEQRADSARWLREKYARVRELRAKLRHSR